MAPNDHRSDGAAMRGRPRRLPYLALLVWVLFALVLPCLAQSLNVLDVLAFPLGFLLAAQGSLVVLLIAAVLSARYQNRLTVTGDH